MNKKQLQTLIESNVRSILAEEKRKIILEKKVNKLLTERKELSKKAFLLENKYKKNKRTLAALNEAIEINEQFLSKIGRAFKGLFGGLDSNDLAKMSDEKKAKETAKKDAYVKKKLSIIYDLIDKLEDKIRNKFAADIPRIPTVQEIQELSKETRNLYTTLIDFFPELRGKTVTELLRTNLSKQETEEYDNIIGSGKGSASIPGKFLTDMGKLKRSVLSIIRSVQDALEGNKVKLEKEQTSTGKDYSEIINALELKNKNLTDLLKNNREALLSGKLPVEPIGYGTPGWAKAAAAYKKAPKRSGAGPELPRAEIEPSATAVSTSAVKKAEEAVETLASNVAAVAAKVMRAVPTDERKEVVRILQALPVNNLPNLPKVPTLSPPKKIGNYEKEIEIAKKELNSLAAERANIAKKIKNLESEKETFELKAKEPNARMQDILKAQTKNIEITTLKNKLNTVDNAFGILVQKLKDLKEIQESIRRKNAKIV